ncbi:MAG TPA: hypothetical protein VN043_16060, partial [Rhodanobacter sp.]|nr:hypothetical protein [Rhodanobacter sp.]
RAEKNGYLNIKKRECYKLSFMPNMIGISYQGPHVIVFEVVEPGLKFCDLDDESTPGFIWIGKNPGAIMDIEMKDNGRLIHVMNHHTTSHPDPNHTCGEWHYQLFAKNLSGDIYGIPWTSCNGPSDSNPSIKNR